MSERGQEELRELANKYNAAVNDIKDLTDKIKVRARCWLMALDAGVHVFFWSLRSRNAFKPMRIMLFVL